MSTEPTAWCLHPHIYLDRGAHASSRRRFDWKAFFDRSGALILPSFGCWMHNNTPSCQTVDELGSADSGGTDLATDVGHSIF